MSVKTGSSVAAETGGQHGAAGRSFLRRNALVLTMAAVLTAVIVASTLTWAAQTRAVEAQGTRISELEVQLQTTQRQKAEQVDEDVLQSLGISQSRIEADEPIIARFVETAFTWDSGLAYEEARVDLKDRYDLAEEDPFLTDFMPPSRFNEDSSGKRYYYIDSQGMNSAVSGDPDIEVVKVTADEYTYAVFVELAITSDAVTQNGSSSAEVTAERTMLLFVTVDADGGLHDISGVPASGSTRHSA